jgi:hypothetical protein
MKTENITKAAHSIGFAVTELRAALNDANKANDQFAWLVLEQALTEATALQAKITRIEEAANTK